MSSPATPAAPGRAALVQAAVQTWKSQLVNLGGRNTLLYYRDQKVGTLDLAQADQAAVAALMAGRPVRLSALYPDPLVRPDAAKRCRTIYRKSKENFEERGIDTLLVTRGFASWRKAREILGEDWQTSC